LFTAAFAVLPSFQDNHSGDLFPLSLPLFSLSLPLLGRRPLKSSYGSGERCKLSKGVWGGAPAEIKCGAF